MGDICELVRDSKQKHRGVCLPEGAELTTLMEVLWAAKLLGMDKLVPSAIKVLVTLMEEGKCSGRLNVVPAETLVSVLELGANQLSLQSRTEVLKALADAAAPHGRAPNEPAALRAIAAQLSHKNRIVQDLAVEALLRIGSVEAHKCLLSCRAWSR